MATAPRSAESGTPSGALHSEWTGTGPRLVMAHGFTQTGRVWGSIDTDLADDHRVVRVDMPGHAGSTDVAADLVRGGELLAETGGPATYLGYSMGARFCLHAALSRPETVERLVLISGTAGIDDPDERALRRLSDQALADQLDPPDGSPGLPVEEFLGRWLEGPLFAGITVEAGGRAERLRNSGPGLASSLRLAGTGTQRPRWEELAGLEMPVLVITGALDRKFSDLAERMAAAIGSGGRHVEVAGTGHAPHLQQPSVVSGLVRAFVAGAGG